MEYLISIFLLGVLFTQSDFNRYLYFIFGIFALWIISMGFKRIREFRSILLSLFVLSCLGTIFLHLDLDIYGTIISNYLSIYIMANGVAFILCGVLLIKLIVEYSKRLVPYCIVIPILMFNWSGMFSRYTLVCAICWAFFVWFILKKNYKMIALSIIPLAASFFRPRAFIRLWHHLLSWEQAAKETFIVGIGFPAKLIPTNMVYAERGDFGWVFIHNDFLALMRNIGIIPVALLIWFIAKEVIKTGKSIRQVPILTILIAISFQSIMYDVYKAMIVLVVFAVCITKNYETRNSDNISLFDEWLL